MSSPAPFELVRVGVEDLDEIVELQYESFFPFVREIFMGCRTKADLPLITKVMKKALLEDPNDVWIGVKDKSTGKFIAAANWKVFVNGEGGVREADSPPDWLEGEEYERSKAVMGKFSAARLEAMPGPFIYLHICFTDEKYRRRGAGNMMMQWGCDLADQLFLPCWIEASPEGNHLYKVFGFYDYGVIPAFDGAATMKRDARKTPITGGRPPKGA